jgi:DNA-binding transcriptional LysR family regulator
LIKPVHVLPDLHTILSAIEHGNGISLLPTYILNNTNNGSAIILEKFKVSNELYIAYKTKHKSSPELRMAIDLIKSLS